jgi:hypothetical protein
VLGPVVGGDFDIVDWHWGFYMNLLFAALLLPIYNDIIPSNAPSGISLSARARTFDYLSALLSDGTFTSITMATNFAGTLYPWDSPHIISLLAISAIL